MTVPWAERHGGAETMLDTYLRGHDRRQIRIEVAFLEEGPWVAEVQGRGLATHVIQAGRLRHPVTSVRVVLLLRRLIDRVRPDVVLNWSAKVQLYGAVAAMSARRRPLVVWWQHNIPRRGWLDRAATLLPAQAVGCSSHASAEAQSKVTPRRPTFVVHPGIEPWFGPPKGTSFAGGQEPAIGLVGSLLPFKGQDRLLRAVALLRERGLRARLVLVGGQPYQEGTHYCQELNRLVGSLSLEGQVTMTGQIHDAGQAIDGFDVLVSASDAEPFGIVLLEAMARGVPVIAVGSGGPREIIQHERSGLLLERGDPRELADALERVLTDGKLRTRLGASGRKRLEATFTAKEMCANLDRELERVHVAHRGG